MSTGAALARHRNDGAYRTPDDFRAAVVGRFGAPDIDLACDESNRFGPVGYTVADNALIQPWTTPDGCYGWLNPPYGSIGEWARRCAESRANILLLVPASIGANWYRDWVYPYAKTIALNGRMSFDGKNPYPKDLMLCQYAANVVPRSLEIWDWKRSTKVLTELNKEREHV